MTPSEDTAWGEQTAPADEAALATPVNDKDLCPLCRGQGLVDGRRCEACQGTGRIVAGIDGG